MTAATRTPQEQLDKIIAGARVRARDEEWLVRSTQQTPSDGILARCLGLSPLVRDHEATFLTNLDHIEPHNPATTQLVPDNSPGFSRSRLYLEAVIRKTPIPATNTALTVSSHQLLKRLEFQQLAVSKALQGLRPRLLIADAVGLGKTLEAGMILSELIRRGRGERVLVVTPRHILQQFQHELWTRFAIPLVRLDSLGIQRVRRHIPGNRNPFTYYKRVIISIDTLKNAGKYRHHLENIHWDVVVIDECHNLVNRGTLNNQLARVLAPRTDALLLTSATPHNGNPKSFAELIGLLDPIALSDPNDIKSEHIEHLYVRRHKKHSQVAHELGESWADRDPPIPIFVTPEGAEAELFHELDEVWLNPGRLPPSSGKGRRLFPWTLLKAALSSHRALAATVHERIKKLLPASASHNRDPSSASHERDHSSASHNRDPSSASQERDPSSASQKRDPSSSYALDPTSSSAPELSFAKRQEYEALIRLQRLCDRIDRSGKQAKLERLVEELKTIGVGPRSSTRVVIFSERIATLDWLEEELPARLKLNPTKQVQVLHGRVPDLNQMQVIEDFGLEQHPLRLLLTGDMASEGVNLHKQCHHLVHFDLPWSLITVEQRNGRIDRYGQQHSPQIRALLYHPEGTRLAGDLRVLEKLLEREHHAHNAFGDAAGLFGLHDEKLESAEIIKRLSQGMKTNEIVPEKPANDFDLMMALGASGSDFVAVDQHELPSLFNSLQDFVVTAMNHCFDNDLKDLDIRYDAADPQLVSLKPPDDLKRRLEALPQSLRNEQKLAERLQVTGSKDIARQALEYAAKSTDSQWPNIGHLSPLHPIVDWLVDTVLAQASSQIWAGETHSSSGNGSQLNKGSDCAPVMVGAVERPVFLVSGAHSNRAGRTQFVEWLAVDPAAGPGKEISDMFEALETAGIGPRASNPGGVGAVYLDVLQQQVAKVVRLAEKELTARRKTHDHKIRQSIDEHQARAEKWFEERQRADHHLRDTPEGRKRQNERDKIRPQVEKQIAGLQTRKNPLVRVLAAIVPQTWR